MADPLSVAASAVAIAGTIKATIIVVKKTAEILRQLRQAPEAVIALINELSEFQLCLSRLQSLADLDRYEEGFRGSLENMLERANAAVNETLQLVNDKILNFDKIKSKSLSAENSERLGWFFSKDTIKSHQERLYKIRVELLTVLSCTGVSHSIKTRVEVERIETVTQRIYDRMENLDRRLEASNQMMQALISPVSNQCGPLSGAGNLHQENDMVRVTLSAFGADQPCSPGCDCHCHWSKTHSALHTPGILDNIFGSLFLGYSAAPVLGSPCAKQCRRRKAKTQVRLSYYFPEWFYWRAIKAAMTYSSLGPEFVLRMPKAVPTDWKIFGYAYNGNNPALCKELVKRNASPTDVDAHTGHTALHHAAFKGEVETCQILLHAGADPHAEDKTDITPYQQAWTHILSNDLGTERSQALRALFSDTSHMDEWSFSQLHRIILGFIVMDLTYKTLLWADSDINAIDSRGRTALYWAAGRRDTAKVRFLLEHGAAPQIAAHDGTLPIHFAAHSGDEEIVRLLVLHGSNINSRDKLQKSALHLAATASVDIKFLLDLGADPDLRDCHARTPLLYTTERNSLTNTRVLLARAVDFNAQDSAGWSALHFTVEKNYHDIIRELLAAGTDASLTSNDGRNILHFAAAFGDIETMHILTQASLAVVDSNVQGADGLTAAQVATVRRVDAEMMSAPLDAEWSEAFERLLASVTIGESLIDESEARDMLEDVFLDARDSWSPIEAPQIVAMV